MVAGAGIRGVPEGTFGKVVLVNGLSWIRYWVDFDNGISVGSVNRRNIFTPDEWRLRAERADRGEVDSDGGGDDDGDGGGAADAGGGVSVNGVLVPQLLIDRAKSARERLGA